ncbi:MAG: ribonuclease III [Fusobacteriaceae bacterium]
MERDLSQLEKKIDYIFSDKSLLSTAFIHRSYSNENLKYKNTNNEKLEILGDAVLDLIVTEYLYKKLINSTEGEIARLKSMIVSEPVLARISRDLNVGKFLLLSKGEEITGGRDRNSILGDSFEALLGAIYLDSDFIKAREVILKHLKKYIDNIDENEETIDYKTVLQEYCQKEYKVVPTYELVREEGPDHEKTFEIVVKNNNEDFGRGFGKNKRTAEQAAAKDLVKKLGLKINE